MTPRVRPRATTRPDCPDSLRTTGRWSATRLVKPLCIATFQSIIRYFFVDFLGINFYTSEIVYPVDEGVEDVSYFKDDDADLYKDPTWFTSGSDWLMVTPWGLRKILSWVGSHYPGVDVYITENGVSDKVQVP